MTKNMAAAKESNEGKRKLYYISAEFLIGKLLSNNLINLGVYDEVKIALADNGKDICADRGGSSWSHHLETVVLDDLQHASLILSQHLDLNGDGVGLNYHYGLFKQVFENNLQKETPESVDSRGQLADKDRCYLSGTVRWIYM